MRIPDPVLVAAESALGRIDEVRSIGGGCISSTVRLEVAGYPAFLKFDRGRPPGFFAAEAEGLKRLRAAGSGVIVPQVLGCGEESDGWGWLALEWIEPGRPGPEFGSRLGHGLVEIHRSAEERSWGWEREGFIGSLPQRNQPVESWPAFWIERRLEPQLREALAAGRLDGRGEWETLFATIPELLSAGEEEGPSLLHGDLWSGNVMATSAGEPAVVDPAAYRGHREVDLAMSELFGGFDESFYRSYAEVWPLRDGYREARRGVYQLYYLLVHVNLFGDAYVERTIGTLASVLRAG